MSYNLPEEIKNLKDDEDYEKFIFILDHYDEAVSNPNELIGAILGWERFLKILCENRNLDFIKIRDKILENKTLKYTDCIDSTVGDFLELNKEK